MQCIYQVNDNTMFPLGWNWEWPYHTGDVRAYPEIFYGQNPWRDKSTTEVIPAKISDKKK